MDILLVRIHFIIEMSWWTGLAPWDLEFPFLGSLISTFRNEVVADSNEAFALSCLDCVDFDLRQCACYITTLEAYTVCT